MSRHSIALGALLLALPMSAQIHRREFPRRGASRYSSPATTARAVTNPMVYHGGDLMMGVTHVYYIWYGAWNGNSATSLLETLANSIGGTSYYNINTLYYDRTNTSVSNAVSFAGATTDNYSQGKNLSDPQILQVVLSAINSGRLANDPNGVYFVLTSPDVTATSGFCTAYCGWHSAASVNGTNIKFAFIGDPTTQCLSSCAAQSASPNNNPGADGMASVIAHELVESVTDPYGNGWYDANYEETADKCAWSFGNTFVTPNGSRANLTLGNTSFLIQQNWVNTGGGYCGMQYGGPALSSISPSSGILGTTVPITLTGANFGSGASLSISGSGIAASNVTVIDATHITAQLTLSVAAGAHAISVNTADGSSAALDFSVTLAAPALTSVNPNSALAGSTTNVLLSGSNFVAGASVSVSGTGLTVSNVAYLSPTQIAATLTAASTAVGPHSLTVSTPSGASGSSIFTVNPGAPSLSAMYPSTGVAGSTVAVTLNGSNFSSGSTLSITGFGVSASNVVVASATQMTAMLTLTGGASSHSISIATASGTSNALAFTVNAAVAQNSPALNGVIPSYGAVGNNITVALFGNNFVSGATVTVSGSGVIVSDVVVVNPSLITAQLTVGGSPGSRSVIVTTPGGLAAVGTFTILGPVPTLTDVSPATGSPGSTVHVTLTGTNFVGGTNVSITGSGVDISNVNVVNATTLTADFQVREGNAQHAVVVSTPSGVSNYGIFNTSR